MTDEEYIEMACLAIKRYFLWDNIDNSVIANNYALAVKRLVMKAKEADIVRINGVKSYSSDGQSYNFSEKDLFEITEEIANLLPRKKNFYAW